MPESAEVATIVDQLNAKYAGQTLHEVKIIGGKFLSKNTTNIDSKYFPLYNTQFHAKGKFIYWTFSNKDAFNFPHFLSKQ